MRNIFLSCLRQNPGKAYDENFLLEETPFPPSTQPTCSIDDHFKFSSFVEQKINLASQKLLLGSTTELRDVHVVVGVVAAADDVGERHFRRKLKSLNDLRGRKKPRIIDPN